MDDVQRSISPTTRASSSHGVPARHERNFANSREVIFAEFQNNSMPLQTSGDKSYDIQPFNRNYFLLMIPLKKHQSQNPELTATPLLNQIHHLLTCVASNTNLACPYKHIPIVTKLCQIGCGIRESRVLQPVQYILTQSSLHIFIIMNYDSLPPSLYVLYVYS